MSFPIPHEVVIPYKCCKKWGPDEMPPELGAFGLTNEEWQAMRNISEKYMNIAVGVAATLFTFFMILFSVLGATVHGGFGAGTGIAASFWGICPGVASGAIQRRFNADYLNPKGMHYECGCCAAKIKLPAGAAAQPQVVGAA